MSGWGHIREVMLMIYLLLCTFSHQKHAYWWRMTMELIAQCYWHGKEKSVNKCCWVTLKRYLHFSA